MKRVLAVFALSLTFLIVLSSCKSFEKTVLSTTESEDYSTAVNTEITEVIADDNLGLIRQYFYEVDEGHFSTYVRGRVISEDKVGEKISDVTVTAGWEKWVGSELTETVSTENLCAEVYMIDGISNDVAVALKFIDKGEAVTTNHYYVIMNPEADLTAVEDYKIPGAVYNNFYIDSGEE